MELNFARRGPKSLRVRDKITFVGVSRHANLPSFGGATGIHTEVTYYCL